MNIKKIYSLLFLIVVMCCFPVSISAVLLGSNAKKEEKKSRRTRLDLVLGLRTNDKDADTNKLLKKYNISENYSLLRYFYSITGGRSVKDLSLDFLATQLKNSQFIVDVETLLSKEIDILGGSEKNAEKKEFIAILHSASELIQAKNFGLDLIEQQKKCLEFMKKLSRDIVIRYFATFKSYEERHMYELLFYAAFNTFQLIVTAWQVAQKENKISKDINQNFLKDFALGGKSHKALQNILQRVQSVATLERIDVGLMTKEEVSRQKINIKDFTKEKILRGLVDSFLIVGLTLGTAISFIMESGDLRYV